MSTRRHGRFRRAILRVAPFASFAGLSVLTAIDGIDPLAVLFGIGALVAGKRLLDRRGNERRELKRWRRANAAELGRVAREDRIAAPQIKRLAALQEGVKEGFELLPPRSMSCYSLRTCAQSWTRSRFRPCSRGAGAP